MLIRKGGPSIGQLIQNEASASIIRNRLKLRSILKTIVFCANQMIALRGHREQAVHVEQGSNFRALLDFRIDASDTVLAEHFASAPRNAQYNSKMISLLVLVNG